MIRNFCLDVLNSGPIQRVGREKRHGAVEDVDSSIYETGPGTNILKVHLISMRTLCVRYSRKTRRLSQFFGGKKNIYNPPDFNHVNNSRFTAQFQITFSQLCRHFQFNGIH